VLRFVADADEIGREEPFADEVLAELGRIIPAAWIGYEERDFVARRSFVCHEHPSFAEVYGAFELDAHVVQVGSPICRFQAEGHLDAVTIWDLEPRGAAGHSRHHSVVLKPLDVADRLAMATPIDARLTQRFSFDRIGGRFGARDKHVLESLRPHFLRLRRAAANRQRLRAALAGLEWQDGSGLRGVLLLGPQARRIEYASRGARRLIGEYFDWNSTTELPPDLGALLDGGSTTLMRSAVGRRLTIDRIDDALLLEERVYGLALLTPREREILALAARGKTNREIAELTVISTHTVRKHLENIYAKLGVHTRTAAAAHFARVLPESMR
jgi:DNA-binding CsgD family transcriptional regulator